MKRLMISGACAGLFLVATTREARAQFGGVVVCPTCASQVTAGAQLAQEVATVQQALNMYQQLVTAGRLLSNMQWRDAASDLMNISSIVQTGQNLAFSAANLDTRFAQTFPGMIPPPSAQGIGYYGMYQNWSNVTMQTIQGALRGTGLSYQQMMNQQSYLQYLQSASTSSLGQMQAIQAGNQVGIEAVKSLNGLQAIMLSDMQAKSAMQGYQVQNDMLNRQLEQKLFGSVSATPRDGWSLPTWP